MHSPPSSHRSAFCLKTQRLIYHGKHSSTLMIQISYCDAPTGSGKTYAIEGRIAELVNDDQTVLLVQPTKQLCEQTRQNLQSRFGRIRVHVLNGNTVQGSAIYALTDYLKKPYDGPHAIITTWASFIALPYVDNRSRFHLIFDEVPSGFELVSRCLPDNHKLITDKLKLGSVDKGWARLIEISEGSLRAISENRRVDEATKIIKPIAEMIYRRKYDTFVEIEPYEMLLKGSPEHRWLKTFSVIRAETFEGYASVTILGTRASETILFRVLQKQGVAFVEDANLRGSLRYTSHPNGHLIDFYYAFEQNWSLTKQRDCPEMRGLYEEAVMKKLRGKSFCWLDNKEYEDRSPLNDLDGNEMLPHSSHGLNHFMGTDNVVIMTALNYGPEAERFLTDVQEIDKEVQKVALDYHSTYQACCRTSVRDMSNNHRKIIVLPDRPNCAWQRRNFPGSTMNSLGIEWKGKKRGPMKKYATAAEKQKAYRERRKRKECEAGGAGVTREAWRITHPA